MSPEEIAMALVAALKRRGVVAVPGPSIQYGQKVEILSPTGIREGFVVVYAGKKGPRLTKNEFPAAKSDRLTLIDGAWEEVIQKPDQTGSSTQVTPPNQSMEAVTKLSDSALVDYARHLAGLAGRASLYAGRPEIDWSELHAALRTLAERVGYPVPDSLTTSEEQSAKGPVWADFADHVVERILERQTR